jgi:NADH-quinone oxidoreductase subunit H
MHTLYKILDFPATKWVLLVMLFVMPLASLLTWAERRQSAMMQDRRGPNRANIGPIKLWGILHFVADALKMISKEDFIPGRVHRTLYALAPILALAPVLAAVCLIPFGPTIYPERFFDVLPADSLAMMHSNMSWSDAESARQFHESMKWTDTTITLQMFRIDFGLLFYFAILSIANYGTSLAGWASYNKFALLGGLRASSQMMSYEVAMGLSLMSVFLTMGTLEPGAMVDWQAQNYWGVFTPLPLVAFILFFTAAIAETKRAPFDLPEGEPEIIGYFVEYSGMRFGMFFLAEFIEVVFISMIITTVFFGGYHIPFLHVDGFQFGDYHLYLQHWLVVLLQLLAFGAKVVFFCWLQLAIRWTLPRFRADQLMTLGWKRLLPLSLANVMLAALLNLWL